MATRVFADDDLTRLRGFPEINKEELIRFFTLTPVDVGFIDPGRGRSPKDRLGLAVQLCTRCRGLGSSRRMSPRRPRWRWLGSLSAFRFLWVSCGSTVSGSRPAPGICVR
ncbi:DUF4158 domain-containing protein [Streptomyces sp. SCA2-4]|nr:DUF4158 domain-containing protein [Streptomyces huiliensis]